MPAAKFTGYADDDWHTLKLSVLWEGGQTLTIDNVEVGKNAHNYSRFNWKDTMWFGKSSDLAHKFTGSIRNFSYRNVETILNDVEAEAAKDEETEVEVIEPNSDVIRL
jgi:hypothetical protein